MLWCQSPINACLFCSGSYPRQGVPYPTQQPVYPTQPNPMQYGGFAPPPQQSGQFYYGTGQYGMPPPPYSEAQHPSASSGYNIPVCVGTGERGGKSSYYTL